MHEIQEQLLKLAGEKNLGQYTLREIGAFIGETSPQKVKHHMTELQKKGLLKVDKAKRVIKKAKQEWEKSFSGEGMLLSIPILGAVNAGPAQIFADTNIEGFLKVSSALLNPVPRNTQTFLALKVVGPSMNRAEINKKRIEDGDYVIVDIADRNVKDGDIVLSIIDGMANIKRFRHDKGNGHVVLMSESTKDFPPIFIHESDNFMINGKVIQVIKKPRFGV
ncbi:MAG: S24 family peptidase [Candidatus Paceibacterota bacterium]|jgi:repressor LexA